MNLVIDRGVLMLKKVGVEINQDLLELVQYLLPLMDSWRSLLSHR